MKPNSLQRRSVALRPLDSAPRVQFAVSRNEVRMAVPTEPEALVTSGALLLLLGAIWYAVR